MIKLTEYDLAYICYYSEKVALPALVAGYSPRLRSNDIKFLLEDLRKKEVFDFYKNTYEELLEE
ncbi:hypothetical protein LW858_29265 (plasmid) [Bacillus cereus]|uniref:Uncharacterized protein n=1 Tax=Bacillus cereus TaxID=1396 RepID=A0A9X6GC55_BACCE|nr:hypothetical protein [Bacillus cereus]OOR70935.1 hypothetical protein BLX06_33645 [Bacillus cereus]UIJ69675.1 hypothetical protein LW858_29265 [Bacillus cereus]